MTESILQAYLNEQHIKTDVQENIESLKKAIKDIKTFLTRKKERVDIISFTLVALDPKVKDTDPVVQQIEKIIIKKWPAFKNSITATKDKSTTYVRAVILESLSQLSKDDAATAALVWLTARDVIGHYQLGSEERVISIYLQELADQTEENGHAFWSSKSNLSSMVFNGSKISAAALINEKYLVQQLKRALAPADEDNEGGNPHTPVTLSSGYNNSIQINSKWGVFAADKLAKGITEIVNSALSLQNKSIQEGLDAYFAKVHTFLEELNKAFTSSITANNKRSELLWWKQSMYSRSLKTSYRRLDRLNAAVCMAVDLAEQVEAFYPESVDYLLRETLKDLYGEQTEEERLLIDWLTDSNSLHTDIQSALNKHAAVGDERKPLLNAWANVVHSGEATNFFIETGINNKAKLTLSDMAVWLFHGLQAQKLATGK